MISTEIYIEDNRLDLVDEISTEFQYAIDDIQDFGSKNTSFSKTINITGTANNNKIFGFVFDLGNANITDNDQPNVGYNFNASRVANCRIFIDKIQIFKGVLRLLEIVKDGSVIEYQCAVFGELGGFISALGNNRLEDLKDVSGGGYPLYSEYNEAWTAANITDQSVPVSGSPILYGLIDIGNVSTNKVDFDFKAFRPCYKVKEMLEKIRIQSGYTWDFSYLSNSLFDRLVIPTNRKVLSNSTTQAFYANAVAQTYNTENLPDFSVVTAGNFTLVGSSYRYNGASALPCTIQTELYGEFLDVQQDGLGGYYDVTVYIRVNSLEVKTETFPVFALPRYFNLFLEYNTTLNTNDTIDVWVSSAATQYSITSGYLAVNTTTVTDVPINYGETIQFDKQLPQGIFQRDFFLSICKMFNLYVYDDPVVEKKIIVKPYIDFYKSGIYQGTWNASTNNPALSDSTGTESYVYQISVTGTRDLGHGLTTYNANDYVYYENGIWKISTSKDALTQDWTNKIDRSKPMSIKPMSEINARYYQFKFKQDNDLYNENYRKKYAEGYGDRIFDTEFDFVKDTDTTEVIFSASPLYRKQGTDKIYPAIYKVGSGGVEESMDFNIRIFQAKYITEMTGYKIENNGSPVQNGVTTYTYVGHLDDPFNATNDINFGAPKEIYYLATTYPTTNLFNAYYSDYMAEITDKDSKLLTCNILLNTMDIYNLDFGKLVWIDGVLFRLNTIEGYNPMDYTTTKVSLLKAIEKTF